MTRHIFWISALVLLGCCYEPSRQQYGEMRLGALKNTDCTIDNLKIKSASREEGCRDRSVRAYVVSCSGRTWHCRQSADATPVTECAEVTRTKPSEAER